MLGILFVSVVVGVISVARSFSIVGYCTVFVFCPLVLSGFGVESRELGPLHWIIERSF